MALTRALAVEWARHNIQVNAIAPGWFVTAMNEDAFADPRVRDRLLRDVPARRTGRLEELGPLVVYLASAASDYMTGEDVFVDGGFAAGVRAAMNAAVLTGPRAFRVATRPGPDAAGRARRWSVSAAAGICGTDYRIWTGERPVRVPADSRARVHRRRRGGGAERQPGRRRRPRRGRAELGLRDVRPLPRGEREPVPGADRGRHRPRRRVRRAGRPARARVLAGARPGWPPTCSSSRSRSPWWRAP